MSKRSFLLVLSIIIMMVLLGGCRAQGGEETIRIGVVTALSGNLAPIGQHIRQGLEMAANEINENGGVDGRQIELIIEDSQGNPTAAVNAVSKIMPQIHVLHGPLTTSEVLAVMPLIEEAQKPDLTNSASAPEITHSGNPYMFRLHVSEGTQAAQLVSYAVDELAFSRFAILHDSSDYGRGGMQALVDELAAHDLGAIAIETFTSGDVDFSSQLLSISEADPEAIFVWGFVNEDARIAIQMDELGIGATMMINNVVTNPQLLDLAGAAANGMVGVVPAVPDQSQPRVAEFWEKYQELYDVEPALHAYESYDAMYVIADAISRAGTLDGNAIRDALSATELDGISGHIRFDEFGDFIQQLHIGEVRDGAFVRFDE